ncbi:LysR family transcriptional regulator [Gracilibacillus oryzae]|uniref:LysR family transcriptional regulator n=1 Tax=Gracilibacillus oryzae TaxID=1672701 RepID=A0A7C8GTU3_9BACI|nr:LysR family transcriptional regulator [Gracilibacillus oryzae]KAB8137741.1 LysR family transcriptional regulator [Gracilibacillus oryzae]
MELRHLITFKTIVDLGGFNKAAEHLGYAQSTITSHIKELEKELAYPLFDRLGKKVTLTNSGRLFYPYAIEIINLYKKSKEVIQESDEPSGELTIGVSESVLVYWIPEMINDFMEMFPKIELIIKSINYARLEEQLKHGEIDVAILVERNHWHSKELTIQKIKEEDLCLVHSTDRTRQIPKTMLVTEYSCSWRPLIDNYIKNQKDTKYKKIELPGIEAIKKCITHGLGETMLPYFTIKKETDTKETMTIEHVIEKPLAIYTAHHKDKWISANLESFFHVMKRHSGNAIR